MEIGSIADWIGLVVAIVAFALTVYLERARLRDFPMSQIKKITKTGFYGLVVSLLVWGIFQLGKASVEPITIEVTRVVEVAKMSTVEVVEIQTMEVTRVVEGNEVIITKEVTVAPQSTPEPIVYTRVVTEVVTATSPPPTNTPETPSAPLGDIEFSYLPPVSDVADVNFELTNVEVLPNKMRLHVEIWNQSANDIRISFRQGFSVLIDELGNEYPLLATDAPVIEGGGPESTVIRSGVKMEFWFEFSSPIDEAKSFNVRLFATGTASRINFSEFSMELEY